MPRYVVERSFPNGVGTPLTGGGLAARLHVADHEIGVIWLESYVSDDRTRTYCVVEATDPEAIRRAARRYCLPVDRITRVTMLNPYPYPGASPAL